MVALLDYIATYIYYQGQWKDPEGLQREALELKREVLGEERPHTRTSMNNLVSTYSNQGRWN